MQNDQASTYSEEDYGSGDLFDIEEEEHGIFDRSFKPPKLRRKSQLKHHSQKSLLLLASSSESKTTELQLSTRTTDASRIDRC